MYNSTLLLSFEISILACLAHSRSFHGSISNSGNLGLDIFGLQQLNDSISSSVNLLITSKWRFLATIVDAAKGLVLGITLPTPQHALFSQELHTFTTLTKDGLAAARSVQTSPSF